VDIANVSQTSAANTAAFNTQGANSVNSDFETFIKMLTVQMQNQDPLNPIESADFAVQLATFSTVEQQVLTNDLLTNLGNQLGALSVAQLSGWVGMDAWVEMPVVFEGDPVRVDLDADPAADQVQLVVYDDKGEEVDRQDITIQDGGEEYIWDGTDSDGNSLPAGTYVIGTESLLDGEVIAGSVAAVHGRIVEARNENGKPTLVMDNGQQVVSGQILGLKAPESASES